MKIPRQSQPISRSQFDASPSSLRAGIEPAAVGGTCYINYQENPGGLNPITWDRMVSASKSMCCNELQDLAPEGGTNYWVEERESLDNGQYCGAVQGLPPIVFQHNNPNEMLNFGNQRPPIVFQHNNPNEMLNFGNQRPPVVFQHNNPNELLRFNK